MTSDNMAQVPGAAELLGRGVYAFVPDALPEAIYGQPVVVVGHAVAGAIAALRLSRCCCSVTLVTRAAAPHAGLPRALRRSLRACANIAVRYGTEVVWAAGVGHLEAVVLRRAGGRVEARNASALFVLADAPEIVARPAMWSRGRDDELAAGDDSRHNPQNGT